MRRLVWFVSTFAILMIVCAGASALQGQQPASESKAPSKNDEERSSAIVVYQQPETTRMVGSDDLVKVVFSGLTAFEESEVLKAFG